ncbi:DUF6526 family protein [Foetidibacter luteolus]|uniref:DUF6526 family protein n=1 Tax=Foetidibacter luteolus TaxID=2608880 RepID=UPI00129C078F|nr:DUF6526 family protein [Foetidibacter luteolus]
MKKQDYHNHVKYYPLHHFVFYPLLLAAVVACFRFAFTQQQWKEWLAIGLVFVFIGWLSFMLRQHYALGNQNRIVRLEMRFRYYVLTNKKLEALEPQLSFKQLAALRFASDEELLQLIEITLHQNLSPDGIKKLIKNWQPDDMRV